MSSTHFSDLSRPVNDAPATPLTLAYSPCPNDTYIFAALTNGLLSNAPEVRAALDDVEALNIAALRGAHEITKVSYALVPELMEQYWVLRSGGALGRGCGPLVVSKPGAPSMLSDYADKLIAIPGERTTAFLLLSLAFGRKPQTINMRFDRIVDAVAQGIVDAGLIIHESRFTYAEAGLQEVADLGEWWEKQTSLPIPLGAILAQRDLGEATAREINAAIRESLQFARNNEKAILPYVRQHAFESGEDVMRKHIELYVNNYTDDVGDDGIQAVQELYNRARQAGLLPPAAKAPEFIS